jgi:hypothetical protein
LVGFVDSISIGALAGRAPQAVQLAIVGGVTASILKDSGGGVLSGEDGAASASAGKRSSVPAITTLVPTPNDALRNVRRFNGLEDSDMWSLHTIGSVRRAALQRGSRPIVSGLAIDAVLKCRCFVAVR